MLDTRDEGHRGLVYTVYSMGPQRGLPVCVTLGKWLNLSEPPFSYLKNESIIVPTS